MPIEVAVQSRVARIGLNAPPKNILGSALTNELRAAFEALRQRTDHNAVVLYSLDAKTFSAGADIREHIGREACERMLKSAHTLIAEVLRAPVPTICVVQGDCLGGGYELALSCDQIHAIGQHTFGFPEIRLGCFPPAATVLAQWKLPPMLAVELIQSGLTTWGIHTAIHPERTHSFKSVYEVIEHLEKTYSDLPRGPLVIATRLLRSGAAERFLAQVGGIEQVYLEQLLQLHDAKEGPEAFLAKRKPVWDHR